MNFARLSVALVVASSGINAWAQPLELKGVPFGASVEAFREANRWAYSLDCATKQTLRSDTTCVLGKPSYATVEAREISAHFFADELGAIEVNFPTLSGFDTIRDAVTSKYGKPARETKSNVGNKLGAVFQQVVVTWVVRGAGTIELRRFTDTLDEGVLTMRSTAYQTELQRRASQLPSPKKDI